jgi:hypothetical protein
VEEPSGSERAISLSPRSVHGGEENGFVVTDIRPWWANSGGP